MAFAAQVVGHRESFRTFPTPRLAAIVCRFLSAGCRAVGMAASYRPGVEDVFVSQHAARGSTRRLDRRAGLYSFVSSVTRQRYDYRSGVDW